MDPSGGLLWNRDFIAIDEIEDAVATNAAGDVFVAGATGSSDLGLSHAFVRKLDGATGALTWQRRLGDDDDIELLGDVATRENGAIVAIGSVNVLQLLPDDEIHRAGTFAGTITLGPRRPRSPSRSGSRGARRSSAKGSAPTSPRRAGKGSEIRGSPIEPPI